MSNRSPSSSTTISPLTAKTTFTVSVVVVVSVEVLFPDGGRVAVADTVRVGETGAEQLDDKELHA